MNDKAIVLHPADNVATAVSDLAPGEELLLQATTVRAIEAIPFGHKIALRPIASGTDVLKYGESIGLARCDIRAGAWVHVQNVDSQRGRGDRGTEPSS